MTVQTAIAIALVTGIGTIQYILTVQALRDLRRRPRVRGDNKMAWALLILCVPIAGALIYGWMGPTSLLRRPHTTIERPSSRHPSHTAARTDMRRNITPISDARRLANPSLSQTAGDRRDPRDISRTGS